MSRCGERRTITSSTPQLLIRVFTWIGYVCAVIIFALMAGVLYLVLRDPQWLGGPG
jgi:hypothetical protein